MEQVSNYQQHFNYMKFIKNFILILLFIFPISNSFGAMVTHIQSATVSDGGANHIQGIQFNKDGTKMFTLNKTTDGENYTHINEYTLSTPFDISTRTYAGPNERCELDHGGTNNGSYDLEFSSDGMKLFFAEGPNAPGQDKDKVFRFDLTTAYDISTCLYANNATSNLDSDALQNGSNAGDITTGAGNRLQGMEINDDGTKLFLIFHGDGAVNTRLLEYQLSTPYDLTTISLVTTAGIELEGETANPYSIRFSANGKRIFSVDHTRGSQDVTQISLTSAYDTSGFTIDGTVSLDSLKSTVTQPRGIAFSASGLKMYIGNDKTVGEGDTIHEFDLVCPFNIIEGKCPSITTGDRTGIAIAQIEVATRTIEHSTDTALNLSLIHI